jgi:hypothetical protein
MPYARSRTSAGIPCNDTYDVDRHELKLIRAGHYLVYLSRKNGVTVSERTLLWEAAEIIWEAKKAYRVDLAAKRKAAGDAFAAKMRGQNGSATTPVVS